METIVLGWIAAVAGVMVIAIRPWSSPAARTPLPWAAGVIVAGLSLWQGALGYADAMRDGLWTAASLTIGFVPIKALIYGLLSYAAVRALNSAIAGSETDNLKRFGPAGALTLACLYFAVAEVRATLDQSHIRTAGTETLSPDEIAAVVARIDNGEASDLEITTFLANPRCPSELFDRFVGGTAYQKGAIAANPAAPRHHIVALARDADAGVRVYAVDHKTLPLEDLVRLSSDADDRVRERTAWMATLPSEDFNRLTHDPSSPVRATAARQRRIADADLRRLLDDPDEGVREAAAWTASGRDLR